MQEDIIVVSYDKSLVCIYQIKLPTIILYLYCCLTTSVAAIRFFLWYCHYFTEALEAIHYVKATVYFTTLIAGIDYNKRSVVVSKKFEGYCVYFRKAIIKITFLKGAY